MPAQPPYVAGRPGSGMSRLPGTGPIYLIG